MHVKFYGIGTFIDGTDKGRQSAFGSGGHITAMGDN
jgi:hypothetical protein